MYRLYDNHRQVWYAGEMGYSSFWATDSAKSFKSLAKLGTFLAELPNGLLDGFYTIYKRVDGGWVPLAQSDEAA